MILFTSLKGAFVTTNRILVFEGVLLEFFLLWGGVVKQWNTTGEPDEHEFVNCQTNIQEFTALEFSHLKKTTERRSSVMFTSLFAPSRDPKKGYQVKHAKWVNYNKTDSSILHSVPVDIYDNDGAVSEQLWEAVHNFITFSSHMIRAFLAAMGVKI